MTDLQHWEQDKALYLFTSLTSGSSHIVTATNRIETILKSSRIPFSYVDTATDESARKLFQRRGKGKKLPFLVKEGFVIGDLQEIEEWNEFGELKQVIGAVDTTATSITTTPAKSSAASPSSSQQQQPTPTKAPPDTAPVAATTDAAPSGPHAAVPLALRQAAFEAASAVKGRQKAAANENNTSKTNDEAPAAAAAATTPDAAVAEESGPASPASPGSTAAVATAAAGVSPGKALRREGSAASGGSVASQQFVPEHYDPAPTAHRGSSVSLASEAEIREIECKEAIPEEDEDEDEDEGEAIVTAEPTKSLETKLVGDKLVEKPKDATVQVDEGMKTLKVTDADDTK